MTYDDDEKMPSTVCDHMPNRKCNNMIKGIKLIVFWLNAASAGIRTEYLNMMYFLQKNDITKYTVVIGISIGNNDEYITAMKKFKHIIAFYVAKSN